LIGLRSNGFTADVVPETGGGLASFRHDGVDLLRPAPAGADVLELASFPLVPYPGRIRHGRFAGVELPPNRPGFPYPLHGHGWLAAWEVVKQGADFCHLTYLHAADAWPWSYRAEQIYRLDADGLALELSVHSLSDHPMPLGLGQHPYFPGGARIRTRLSKLLVPETDLVADHTASIPDEWGFAAQHQIGTADLDHGFTGWNGKADLIWPDRTLRVTASEQGKFVQIYAPAGQNFFCFEPMSCLPNAVNWPNKKTSGLKMLEPGETARLDCRIDLGP
jgi:aldose 1-epimerase